MARQRVRHHVAHAVLELGAGTGVCGLVLAALGSNVEITDLPSRLPLIKKNYELNKDECRGSVEIKALDWATQMAPTEVDVLEVLCVYERRDIGEPVEAQKYFSEAIVKHYEMYRDPSTSSNYDEITVTHYDLKWTVSFTEKKIFGSVVITLKALKDVDRVVFDSNALAVASVKLDGKELSYKCEPGIPIGDKFIINTPHISAGKEIKLEISYSTASEPKALQFMDAELTADKKAPYLYSQCQSIHARSLVPCMDTPSVKSSYDAEVTVPSNLVCLMSAIGKGSRKSGDSTVYTFHQPISIPSYLLAIVAGHIERREISPRCDVWCEPSLVDSAKWEFEATEKILQVAEELAGPYRWGRYDLVVLPPTFPFGGMENPCLTFVTPTLLAGDRSLVNVVAHEIAHSWTGNLVSNASWEHFWLNEGFTVFLERKIKGRIEGELERQFESECGFDESLTTAVKTFGETHEFTKLIPNLKDIDPDDSYSSVPYEKGSALLFTLEQLLGDNARFEKFLRSYIEK
ncbi:unnamed protein product [Nippostrongylus brasiliensis]|uniref:Leukotriene A-4 hydrolase (inferred by orthology to a human protein) n=1 Tax=Nippostrongylus brasiliensis TaxID=27835 RepID=A0A0N4YFI5_NIPBR|nr:unnamed protein product [Nippostrongylus brasiliensis]